MDATRTDVVRNRESLVRFGILKEVSRSSGSGFWRDSEPAAGPDFLEEGGE